ncbi:hypothetical protein LZZ85_17640 [Terrimonas sp. NA20]|uniref:Cytochrome c-552/4 domain-containing protein n=1 Tax=Terrimonas ginsenosidimutans TaxID=2908004 RepID=A0ABS9KUU4_9BACT|nr:multiheme c-type cytochrome [Terrimonas ginsenosidimutans]MCG2616124.1 hypothetical protein [Terrimonas ginsenosidimutans]
MHRRSVIIVLILTASIFILCKCSGGARHDATIITDNNGEVFAGYTACAGCHKDVYEQHLRSAHFSSSAFSSADNIKGSFDAGANSFVYTRHAAIEMQKRDSSFYQVAFEDGRETKARRFDITIGSGNKGQTYLYWMENRLFQLPISYFTPASQWSNSPGFPNRIVFNRPITSRCLECHATFAKVTSPQGKEPEEFDRMQTVLTISCEKCHGPGAEHIKFQQAHPTDTVGQEIIKPGLFSRQQQLDLCASCHGGRLRKTQPSFSYQSGAKLTDHFILDTANGNAADIDVHGNQYGLLSASECFKQSDMTCGSCHSPHGNEKNNLKEFSRKCMTCHSESHDNFCTLAGKVKADLTGNCIDCHMPKQPSRAIAVFLQGADAAAAIRMRTHYIKVYPEETAKAVVSLGNLMKEKK